MSNQINRGSEEKRDKKKIVFLILILIVCFLLIIGIIAAFFSDMFSRTGDVTTGTLKINGVYTFYHNGTETELNNIENLNPGDVIVVKGTISNTGNKSAWIRDRIAFSSTDNLFLPFLEVYEGELTREDLLDEVDNTLLTIAEGGIIVSGNRVINGFGPTAETESGEDYEYIGSASYEVTYTVYFLPTAGNETQNSTLGLTVSAQALQFRNNHRSEPGEAAWSAVTAVE